MARLAFVAAAFATSTVLLGGATAPARAADTRPFYVATPEAAPASDRLITRSTIWRVRDGAYTAPRAPERATILCELVARDVGRLSGFSAGGQALDADALAKCNARAKAAPVEMARK